MSDLAVANLGMENRGVESLWAEPAATARDALEKVVAQVYSHHHIILLRLLMG